MEPHERIIFALDVPSFRKAEIFAETLVGKVGMFKIGLELFIATGPAIFDVVAPTPVMLDLKLHDIPETVERAILRAGEHGVKFVTIHTQQRETLVRAKAAAEKNEIQLLAVTVLTSMIETDLKDLLLPDGTYSSYSDSLNCFDPKRRALALAKFASSCGINGFVCSPQEVQTLRGALRTATFVVPGIRPVGSEEGDQKRTGTPAQAVKDGADYLVVGRPIRDAENPVAAAQAIAAEIATLDAARSTT